MTNDQIERRLRRRVRAHRLMGGRLFGRRLPVSQCDLCRNPLHGYDMIETCEAWPEVVPFIIWRVVRVHAHETVEVALFVCRNCAAKEALRPDHSGETS